MSPASVAAPQKSLCSVRYSQQNSRCVQTLYELSTSSGKINNQRSACFFDKYSREKLMGSERERQEPT